MQRVCGFVPFPKAAFLAGGPQKSSGRVCSDWASIPHLAAIVVLVVCLFGVILSLIWNQPYLAIPFGIGCIAALYFLFYIAPNYKNLKGLKAQVDDFTVQNGQLRTTVQDAQRNVGELRLQIGRLEESNKLAEEARKNLEDTNTQLKTSLEQSEETRQGLEGVLEQATGLSDQQSGLVKDLQEVVPDLLKSAERSSQFHKQLTGFETFVKGYQAESKGDQKQLKSNLSVAADLVKHMTPLVGTLVHIAAAKPEKELQLLAQASEAYGQIKGQIEAGKAQLEALKTLTSQQNAQLDRLTKEVDRLRDRRSTASSVSSNSPASGPPSTGHAS